MLYIAAHKKFDDPQLEEYRPIHVGAAGKPDLGYLRDDTGDNISERNPNFCELTGVYWIWKNVDDDYKGLVHYRRYFGKSNLSSRKKNIYTHQQMIDLLQDADIVLPYVESFVQNAKDEIMVSCCTEEIFSQLRQAVATVYPNYLMDFDVFFSQNHSTLFNMMFCRKELFDSYCQWLFDILFEVEKNIDLTELNTYQQRIYGFLSERLLNIWVCHNNLRVVNTCVIHTEMTVKEKLTLLRRRFTNEIRYRLVSRK